MDEKFEEVFSYLQSNQYPKGVDKCTKRSIRRTASLYELKDGEILLRGTTRKWIADKEQQRRILQACHDDPLGETCSKSF